MSTYDRCFHGKTIKMSIFFGWRKFFLSEAVYFIMHTLNFIVYKYHVIKLFFKLFCFYQCLNYGVLEKYGSCC